MSEFWCDYVKKKTLVKEQDFVTWIKRLHCFIIYVRTDDIYKDIAEDIDTKFDTSNYELN